MKTASNDDLIRAVFTATDEAKTRALAVLETILKLFPSGETVADCFLICL